MTTPSDAYTPLLEVARAAIAAHLNEQSYTPPKLGPPLERPGGVFVTLRDRHGRLRGCIGHVEPVLSDVVAEAAECAVLAAVRDPRFAPLAAEELPYVRLEVSVLLPPEPVTSVHALDPRTYGVVVTSGARRGLLLPGIESIDSADAQIAIARQKAGIGPDDPVRLERFETIKVVEDDPIVEA